MDNEQKIQELIDTLKAVSGGGQGVRAQVRGDGSLMDELAGQVNGLIARLETNKNAELKQQREFFDTILNRLPVEFVLFDDQLRFVFINEKSVKDPEMRAWLIGKKDADYFIRKGLPVDRANRRNAALQEVLESGRESRFLEVITDAQGKAHHILRIVNPIHDDHGRITHLAGYSIEISDVVEKESALREKNEVLERINHELDQFVYRASHDLRAPLVSLMGLVNLAEQEPKSPALEHLISLMSISIHRMDHFILDIINHSRNSRQAVSVEPLDLVSETEKILQLLRQSMRMDKIDFSITSDLQENPCMDAYRVGIILNNLISNAIKYQDPTKASHWVRVHFSGTPAETVIEVSDNGIGIAKEHVPHVFTMFYRATIASSGTGMGLYIVQEIVRRLGGQISLDSKEHEGTRIQVTLPVARETAN